MSPLYSRDKLVLAAGSILPLILLFVIAVVAGRPLLSGASFLYSDDGLDHLLRIYALDRAIHQGIAFPRWIPDLALGYGYLIFNFYPPLSAFVGETLVLFGWGFAQAIKGTLLLTIAAALVGSFQMGREFFAEEENANEIGILTAAAYAFFPYFIIDIYTRGAMAEALAVAFLPWLVWSLRRALTHPTISSLSMSALFLTVALLSHSLILLIVAPFLIAYVVVELQPLAAAIRVNRLLQMAFFLLIAAMLGAFYWIPFVVELPLVRMGKGVYEIEQGFPEHFLPLSNWIQGSFLYRYGQAPYALGLVPVFLGAVAAILAFMTRGKLRQHRSIVFWGIAAILSAVAITEPVRSLWLALPFSNLIQYPWRLSIVVGLGFSIAIGSLPITIASLKPFQKLNSALVRLAITSVVALMLIWSAVADLAPQELFFPPAEPSLAQLARFEAYSGFIGTTTWGEYLPATIKVPNVLKYRGNTQVGAGNEKVEIIDYKPDAQVFVASSPQPISLSTRTFYFGDWQAAMDGRAAATYPSTRLGLLTVDVPAGDHQITLTRGDTFARQVGNFASVAGALLFLAMSILAIRRRDKEIFAVFGLALGFLTVFAYPAMTALTAHSPPLQKLRIAVSPELDLIGLRVENARLESDIWRVAGSPGQLHLQVYWQVKQSPTEKPLVWRLLDSADKTQAEHAQTPRYGTGNPAAWVPNEIVRDHYDLPLDEVPPGRYALELEYSGRSSIVGAIDLSGSSARSPEPKILNRLDARIGDRIRLLGFDAPYLAVPGKQYPTMLYWQADQNVNDDFTVFVQLLDTNGNVAARPQYDTMPGGGLSPTSLWIPGRTVVDRRDFNLPRDLRPGLYTLVAGMYHYPDLIRLPVITKEGYSPDDWIALTQVKVRANIQGAAPAHMLNYSLGSAISLQGYDLYAENPRGDIVARASVNDSTRLSAQAAQTLSLKLYWRAREPINTDYKVFVHIVDGKGQVALQEDRLPDRGNYPTRIWEAGETIADLYQMPLVSLAPGNYSIVVGMYEPRSGERLIAVDANGRESTSRQVEIGSLAVVQR